MLISQYDYELPEELIAQLPADKRENSKMMVLDRTTQTITHKHFYDITAHRFIEENCADLGLKYVKGLSADMDDLTSAKGRKEALEFFRFVLFSRRCGMSEPSPLPIISAAKESKAAPQMRVAFKAQTKAKKAVIVADYGDTKEDAKLRDMIARFQAALPMQSEVVNIREFPFAGGCLGCFAVLQAASAFIKTGLMITCASTFKAPQHSCMPTR